MIADLRIALALSLLIAVPAGAAGPDPAPASAQPVVNFSIPPPADLGPPSNGWNFAATLQGQSLDLLHRGAPTTFDPYTRPNGATLGLGWRSDEAQLLLGYRQTGSRPPPPNVDLGPSDHKTWSSSDLIGLSLTIHRH